MLYLNSVFVFVWTIAATPSLFLFQLPWRLNVALDWTVWPWRIANGTSTTSRTTARWYGAWFDPR